MKTIISKNRIAYDFRYATPQGVQHIPFRNGRATVPDQIADDIIARYGASQMYALATIEDQALTIPGNSVLLIRDMGLGDLIMLTPLIRHLAKRGLLVDIQCREDYEALFVGNPYVRQTYALDIKTANNYDCTVDLRQHVEKSEAVGIYDHRIVAFAKHMDVSLSPEEMHTDYFPTLSEVRYVEHYKGAGLPIIGYVWSASQAARSWTDARNLAMIQALAQLYTVLVISERGLLVPITQNVHNLGGKTNIRQTGALLSICDVVITPDTGPFHLAGALDIPTIAYFSTHSIWERQAHTDLTVLTGQGCPLFPCRKYSCGSHLKKDVSPCIDITPAAILAAVGRVLGKKKETVA